MSGEKCTCGGGSWSAAEGTVHAESCPLDTEVVLYSGPIVAGSCPMGCGESLCLWTEQLQPAEVRCANPQCPRPEAAQEILNDTETEHIANITETDFSLKHPLRERLEGELLDCELNRFLKGLSGPPGDDVSGEPILGTCRVVKEDGGWAFERVVDS